MKHIIFISLILISPNLIFSQPLFDLGIKVGVNNSKVTANINDYNSESITKMHFGAFGRLGWNRIYIQPEAYFISLGGSLGSDFFSTVTSFDYSSVGVPMLLGCKVLKGNKSNLRIMAGPVFNIQTSGKTEGDSRFTSDYFRNHYIGYQYGIGVDFWFVTLDARMDYGYENLYSHPSLKSMNRSFLVTAGFKIF